MSSPLTVSADRIWLDLDLPEIEIRAIR